MDHPTFLPDPEDLLERGRQVRSLLSEWRLLICTPQRPYGQLLLANLLGSPPEEPSQQLLGYCRRGAEAPALLPTQASDVLILSQEILLDGPALPVLQQLLQRPRPPRCCSAWVCSPSPSSRPRPREGRPGLACRRSRSPALTPRPWPSATRSTNCGPPVATSWCPWGVHQPGSEFLRRRPQCHRTGHPLRPSDRQPGAEPPRLRHRGGRPRRSRRQPTPQCGPEAGTAEPSGSRDLDHPSRSAPRDSPTTASPSSVRCSLPASSSMG